MIREVRWVKAAHKAVEDFLMPVQRQIARALDVAARGEKAELAKPFKSLGAGLFEVVLRYRTDAYRAIYALRLDENVWVIHAFQKKSKTGIKTPKQEVDLVRQRLTRLREELR
jgi:phage-related protein